MNQIVRSAHFRPPAPVPLHAPLDLFPMLRALRKNPLTTWTQEHFTAPIVAGESALGRVTVVSDPAAKPDATLEGSLAVLAKFKDLEFHSRANLERLAELALTVEDELKQKALAVPLSDVYSAQNAVQTKLTVLIDAYKAECDRLQAP